MSDVYVWRPESRTQRINCSHLEVTHDIVHRYVGEFEVKGVEIVSVLS